MQLICVLTLYPATLLNSLISSNNCFVEPSGFFTHKIVSSVNTDDFTSSLPIWMPFSSFSCLSALATTVFNRNDETGHPCLVSNRTGKPAVFCH